MRSKINYKGIKKKKKRYPKNKDLIKKMNTWKIEIKGLNKKRITLIQKDNEKKNIRKKDKILLEGLNWREK